MLLHHHKMWLANHSDRTPAWLKERLADGFDVHHIDGNHTNNDPLNLALIERKDHQRLHGINVKMAPDHYRNAGKKGGVKRKLGKREKKRLARAGGVARMAKLTPEQRSEIGRQAVMARWGTKRSAAASGT